MKWVSSISDLKDSAKALNECVGKMLDVEKKPPDIAFLFPTPHHGVAYPELAEKLIKKTGVKQVLGCSGRGIIGEGREIEHKPGLSLVCAWLPDVDIKTFHLSAENMPSPDAPPKAWRDWTGVKEPPAGFVILSDPFSLPADALIEGLDYAYLKSVKIGGLASGAGGPGDNALFLNSRVLRAGAVGVAFTGNIMIDPMVTQGCRPIGVPFKVTKCHENFLVELDGCRTLDVLEKLIESLPEEDNRLAQTSLFLGILTNPLKSGASKRDYLIRNLVGVDPERGILSVGTLLRPGQMVQFHLRDKRTAAEDLHNHLTEYLAKGASTQPAGALLFSCLGRGEHLYQTPDHDSKMFAKKMGELALGGFFCNGEIGPVDGTTYLHGFTSSFGIMRPAETQH